MTVDSQYTKSRLANLVAFYEGIAALMGKRRANDLCKAFDTVLNLILVSELDTLFSRQGTSWVVTLKQFQSMA